MDRKEACNIALTALETITPPNPETSWVPFELVQAFGFPSRDDDLKGHIDSVIWLAKVLEEDPRFEVGRQWLGLAFRLKREQPYPVEMERNHFRHLVAAYQQELASGEATVEGVAKILDLAVATSMNALNKLVAKGFLDRTINPRGFKTRLDPDRDVWIQANRHGKGGRLSTINRELPFIQASPLDSLSSGPRLTPILALSHIDRVIAQFELVLPLLEDLRRQRAEIAKTIAQVEG